MIYCFDTSALNELHDDVEAAAITAGRLATTEVRITALNVIETASTRDSVRRISLLQLQKRLAGNQRPLQIPNLLIRSLAIAYAGHLESGNLSIGSNEEGIWIALDSPECIDEDSRQELYNWSRTLENDFCETDQNARPHFQQLFTYEERRPRNAASLLRLYAKSSDFLFEITADAYEQTTGAKLRKEELFSFFRTVPHWPMFFLGWGYSVYSRAIQREKFGRKNAGGIDLWCAAYLPCCDVFVTSDRPQYKALRLINTFNERKTEVLPYSRWRVRFC